ITPPLSLIIAAHNEEAVIGDRLRNALASDYPTDRLQVIVACDGCMDATESIVRGFVVDGGPVVLLSLPRRGKLHAIEEAVRHATGAILVFSDANTMCDRGALRALARNFADPEVGGVAGHTSYRISPGSEASSRGERLYWQYDTWLKRLESLSGSVVSAHGGLYAIRRTLFRTPEDTAVTDDFGISTAVIDQGYRLVFDEDARATELTAPTARQEFRRRVRLMTRGLRGVLLRRRLLNPFRSGFYAVVLFSHKVARRLVPLPLIVLAVSSVYLADSHPFYFAAAVAQAAFYAVAAAGWALRGARIGAAKAVYIPFYYCLANVASALALVQLARGQRIERWEPQRQVR
ncbi:MAG TPA: glycosyltransferase family 2 protein, partial [Vicinamibacterales bacterium]|nr:glycosyltransferase family 2 protein [Vicinamibacterales bacterium]